MFNDVNKSKIKNDNSDYKLVFDGVINDLFRNAFKLALRNPLKAIHFWKTLQNQRKAAKMRSDLNKQGISVPPLAIISVTNRCNLHCKGCYSIAQNRKSNNELDSKKLFEIISEASELGVSIIMIAGGEPFVRNDILKITKKFPHVVFPIFTNGLMLNDDILSELKSQPHVIPVISIEGFEKETNNRRGDEVYSKLLEKMMKLKKMRKFYGISATANKNNFDVITSEEYVEKAIKLGCQLFFYVEYVPVKLGTEHLILNDKQRELLEKVPQIYDNKYPAMFITFPGNEAKYGGCLAAGRGFIHISSDGSLEACPFAPFSDSSLNNISLKEALKSDLLRAIRNNHGLLTETEGGCALWKNKDWLASLVDSENVMIGDLGILNKFNCDKSLTVLQ